MIIIKILLATGALILNSSSLSALTFANQPDFSKSIQNFVDNFPEAKKIPGISLVKKKYVPESKHLICVVEQMHWYANNIQTMD